MKHRISMLLFFIIAVTVSIPSLAQAEERTLMHDGQKRSYIIDKPTMATNGAKLPVIIMLHGGGGNGENGKRMSGFTEKAVPRGVIAVYPSGTSRFRRMKKIKTWNAGHCCGYAMKQNIDDVGFISALIDELVTRDNADPKRIYVTGMSNGAMMTHQIGAKLSHKITAIAPVVGGLFGDEPRPTSAVSVLTINGRLDKFVPLEGGPGGGRFADQWDGTPVKPAEYQGTFWAAANDCQMSPKVSHSANGAITFLQYTCPNGRDVVHYVVNDSGHAWPGGEKGSPRGDVPSRSLDATEVIFDFFMRHSRP